MTHLHIRHRVRNYEVWKSEFDNLINIRRASGEKSYQIFRSEEEPNNLVLLFEWDSFVNAMAFLDCEILEEAMLLGGVVEPPEVYFCE